MPHDANNLRHREEWTVIHFQSGVRRFINGMNELQVFLSQIKPEEKHNWLVYAPNSHVGFRPDGAQLRPLPPQRRSASTATAPALAAPAVAAAAMPEPMAQNIIPFPKTPTTPLEVKPHSQVKMQDRRKFERLELGLRIVLISGRRVFRTHARNISLGGILLAEAPPRDFRHPELKAIIQSPDKEINIEVPLTIIGDAPNNQFRLEFKKLEAQNLAHLSNWINDSKKSGLRLAA